ncbi:hypothetical protein T4D_156 [Trichinella pseudospiralis]|uniref:Uncharacterized protein n=1 Tax=Trichinella pseudospiralis TaxID=6337 RepID=A0A0V1E908_TRIPS|nr:hypothetical protein T4D_156 [Trichinella pseudospiralis]
MNRKTYEEERRKVGSNRSLVNYVRWSGTLVGQLRLLVKLR